MEKVKTIMIGETLFPDCPVRNILSRVGDKWSLLLMYQLLHRGTPMRFSELRKAVPDISQKMLTATLRNLEADGFLVRRVYAEVPPRTEYSLTPRACSFMDTCRPVVQWAIDNFAAIMKDRAAAGKISLGTKLE
ncbi:MAG: winged helix-turn-helix transcriptional regulator [Prevotella sp.]